MLVKNFVWISRATNRESASSTIVFRTWRLQLLTRKSLKPAEDRLNHKCRSMHIFGVRRIFCWISPNLPEKFLCGKLSLYKFSVSVGYSLSTLTNSKTWRLSFCRLSYSIRLIDHSVGNKGVETSMPEFSGILPEISTNQNFWGCACTSSDSGTQAPRASPESSITIYTVERELACVVYLCHHTHFTNC